MAEPGDDTAQQQKLALLRALGFARTDEQVAHYRVKLAESAERHTPEYWARLRAQLGVTAEPAA